MFELRFENSAQTRSTFFGLALLMYLRASNDGLLRLPDNTYMPCNKAELDAAIARRNRGVVS